MNKIININKIDIKSSYPSICLFVLSTPIGNIYDITLRAIKILSIIDFIICENTEYIKKILNKYNIKKKIKIFIIYKLNENFIFQKIINFLIKKKRGAIVSNAGTPTISDPGSIIIKKLQENNIKIIPIPGVTALITALSISGFLYKNFIFLGFLPKKKNNKIKIFSKLKYSNSLIIMYETSKNIKKTINIMSNIFGKYRRILLAKELTKYHENILKYNLYNIKKILKNKSNIKGEYVIILEQSFIKKIIKKSIIVIKFLKILLKKLCINDALLTIHEITHYKKEFIYNVYLNKKYNFK